MVGKRIPAMNEFLELGFARLDSFHTFRQKRTPDPMESGQSRYLRVAS